MEVFCISIEITAANVRNVYKIELLDLRGTRTGILHYPHTNNQLINPVLSRGINRAGSLTFDISAAHPLYNYVYRLQCYLRVWSDAELVFECRPIAIIEEDDVKSVTCEGALAYLQDSVQWRKTYHNTTPAAYLQDKINWHNARVDDPMRQFDFVNCTVTNSTDNVYRVDNDLPTTLENIQKKLVDRLGGYLDVAYNVKRVADQDGNVVSETITRGITYTPDLPELAGQTIRAGVNLLSCAAETASEDFYTVLIPLGATLEGSEKPLDISDVNGGHTYVECAEAVKKYGRIWATKTWEDVTVAANLKKYAQADVNSMFATPAESIEIAAVDLTYTNSKAVVPLRYGRKIYIDASRDHVQGWFDCTYEEIHISDPAANKYTLGGRRGTISVAAARRSVKYYD